MKKKNLVLGMMLSLSATSAQASTVFTATDGDINFLLGSLGNYSLAMFDSSVASFTLNDALFIDTPSTVKVSQAINGDFQAINSSLNSITLGLTKDFVLAITNDNGISWNSDSGYVDMGANAFSVKFNNGDNSVLTVDIQPNPVPVPAAVWLFGTGLMGLVGVARRRV